MECELKFYDNITGQVIGEVSSHSELHIFIHSESKPIQISYTTSKNRNYVPRSLWYCTKEKVFKCYPISEYYCVVLNGFAYVLHCNDVDSVIFSYITPMITYDTMHKLSDVVVIDEMYVIDYDHFTKTTYGLNLNKNTLDKIKEMKKCCSQYTFQTTRIVNKNVRNSISPSETLVVDIDFNNCFCKFQYVQFYVDYCKLSQTFPLDHICFCFSFSLLSFAAFLLFL